MIDLGATEFVLAIPSIPEAELKRLSTRLFDSWESYVGDSLSVPDYSLFLQIEEGSVRGAATVGAVLTAIYFGIGNYGDFIGGLRTINEQLAAAREFLGESAARVFSCPQSRMTSKRQAGTLASLQRLFVRVQKGELTPEQAMERAQLLLGADAASTPEFLEDLAQSLRDCPRYHEQQDLPFIDQPEGLLITPQSIPRTPKTPTSRPDIGPPLQLRVEVWRESKRERKHTRVIKL